jgi:hypothetical protein
MDGTTASYEPAVHQRVLRQVVSGEGSWNQAPSVVDNGHFTASAYFCKTSQKHQRYTYLFVTDFEYTG